MHIIPSKEQVKADTLAWHLATTLREAGDSFDIDDAHLYHKFPLYKDTEGQNVLADALLLSPRLGVVAFALPAGRNALERSLELDSRLLDPLTESGLDHRTMRICFEELRRSQEVSPQPNFPSTANTSSTPNSSDDQSLRAYFRTNLGRTLCTAIAWIERLDRLRLPLEG